MKFPRYKKRTIRISAQNMSRMEKRLRRMKREEKAMRKVNPARADSMRTEIQLTEESLKHLEESGLGEPIPSRSPAKVMNVPEKAPDWLMMAYARGMRVTRK